MTDAPEPTDAEVTTIVEHVENAADEYMHLIEESLKASEAGFDKLAIDYAGQALRASLSLDQPTLLGVLGRVATWLAARRLKDLEAEIHAERAERHQP